MTVSATYLCTLFDIQCCQSVIRKLLYGFMCRRDSSVIYIIKDIAYFCVHCDKLRGEFADF